MIENVRLSVWEQTEIKNKCLEINEELIRQGEEPIQSSKLVHIILELGIARTKIKDKGRIIIE